MEILPQNKDNYTIYSISGCPNCIKVKKFIKSKNLLYEEINCDEYILENKENFIKEMKTLCKIDDNKNVIFPIVFYKNKFIGGYNECVQYIENQLLSFQEQF
jgi:glutaredoxin